MLATALDAQSKLEAEGLHVSCTNTDSLWIAANVRDVGEGIRLSSDGCTLMRNGGHWVAVFPAEGILTYEIPGSLTELVSLVTAVFAHYRRTGGELKDAVPSVMGEAEQYVAGRSPARV